MDGFVRSTLVKDFTICTPVVDHYAGTKGVLHLKSILPFEYKRCCCRSPVTKHKTEAEH